MGTRAPGGFTFDVAIMCNSVNPFLQARVPLEPEFPQGRVLQQKDVPVLQRNSRAFKDHVGLAKHGGLVRQRGAFLHFVRRESV